LKPWDEIAVLAYLNVDSSEPALFFFKEKKMKVEKRFLATLGLFLSFLGVTMAQGELTKESLIRLMEASKARYETITATITYRDYQLKEDLTKAELVTEETCVSRETRDTVFFDVNTRLYNGRKMDRKILYFLGPDYEKRLIFLPEEQTATLSPSSRAVKPFYNLYAAIWGLASYRWEGLWEQSPKATLFFDADKCVYVYEYPIHSEQNSPWLRIFLSPDKEYVPVLIEVLFADKSLYLRQENLNWHKHNGLWIPMLYTFTEFKRLVMAEYTVEQVEVNSRFDNREIDFDFPEGVWVEDRIRGIEYRVQRKKIPSATTEQKMDESPNQTPVLLPPLATDEQLAQVAIKAQQLLEQQTGPDVGKSLAIYPEYVWIEPGRKEYSLLLAGEKDKRSAMVNYRFDGGGLVLHDLKDQIADSGRIQLTIERPAEMSGYGEGTLELDFAGQSKTIHLIAPPILK
jgi:hypothetical protein